jgi:hypothetical protein
MCHWCEADIAHSLALRPRPIERVKHRERAPVVPLDAFAQTGRPGRVEDSRKVAGANRSPRRLEVEPSAWTGYIEIAERHHRRGVGEVLDALD